MNTKRIAWGLGAVALVAVLLWVGLRPHEPDTATDNARAGAPAATPGAAPEPPASVAEAAPARPQVAASPPPAARSSAAPYVLPPAQSALKDIVDELRQEAARGNAQAACRLGAELARCGRARASSRQQLSSETMAQVLIARRMDDAQIDQHATRMLEMQRAVQAEAARCADVDLLALAPPARWLMQAGDAGHVRSMAEALSPGMYDSRTLFRDPGLIPAYRERAARYFQAALEAGEPALIGPWWAASRAAESDPLAAVLPAAWREREFVDALQALIGRAHRGARHAAPLAAAPDDAPRAEAERVFARYFEGKLTPLEAMPAPAAMTLPTLDHFDCESAPR